MEVTAQASDGRQYKGEEIIPGTKFGLKYKSARRCNRESLSNGDGRRTMHFADPSNANRPFERIFFEDEDANAFELLEAMEEPPEHKSNKKRLEIAGLLHPDDMKAKSRSKRRHGRSGGRRTLKKEECQVSDLVAGVREKQRLMYGDWKEGNAPDGGPRRRSFRPLPARGDAIPTPEPPDVRPPCQNCGEGLPSPLWLPQRRSWAGGRPSGRPSSSPPCDGNLHEGVLERDADDWEGESPAASGWRSGSPDDELILLPPAARPSFSPGVHRLRQELLEASSLPPPPPPPSPLPPSSSSCFPRFGGPPNEPLCSCGCFPDRGREGHQSSAGGPRRSIFGGFGSPDRLRPPFPPVEPQPEGVGRGRPPGSPAPSSRPCGGRGLPRESLAPGGGIPPLGDARGSPSPELFPSQDSGCVQGHHPTRDADENDRFSPKISLTRTEDSFQSGVGGVVRVSTVEGELVVDPQHWRLAHTFTDLLGHKTRLFPDDLLRPPAEPPLKMPPQDLIQLYTSP